MNTTASPPTTEAPATTFADLGLSAHLLEALAAEGYSVPTPIQIRAVPPLLAGRDLIGCAQTGTGKTAAFALPLIQRMRADNQRAAARRCRALVLAPTRELAGQIHQGFLAYGRFAGITAAVIYGGVSQRPQAAAMQRGVDVLIATPGRLVDLVGQRLVDLRSVEYLVLDEADRMLDMGFIHAIRRIVAMLPTDRQTLLFSATVPAEVRELAQDFLRNPLEVKTAAQATPAETVTQSVWFVPKRDKKAKLVELLRDKAMGRVIVFTRTKHGADKLHRDLDKAGIAAAAIHGNKSQNHRRPWHRRRSRFPRGQLRTAPRTGNLHPSHRPNRPGRAVRRGSLVLRSRRAAPAGGDRAAASAADPPAERAAACRGWWRGAERRGGRWPSAQRCGPQPQRTTQPRSVAATGLRPAGRPALGPALRPALRPAW